jgi:hypothetical protein
MTFLSEQSFDENGVIKVVVKKSRVLESGEVKDGVLTGKARVKFKYEELTRDDVLPMGNRLAAEVHVLEEGEVFWGISTPPLNHVPKDSHFAHRISLAQSNINSNGGRGRGNTIICHPSVTVRVRACFDKLKTIQQMTATKEMVDVQVPYFQNEPEIIEHDLAAENSVLVIYRGSNDSDQPLIYVEGEGLLMNDKISAIETYGKFVRVP